MKISAVVLTKDNTKALARALKSLSFCDEILAIDDFSGKATIGLLKKHNATIYRRRLNGDFASQRNFGLGKAKGEWVLFIDADEFVSKKLARDIKKAIQSTEFNGYFLNRRDIFLNKDMKGGEWGGQKILRLAVRNFGKWRRDVHETWQGNGKIGFISQFLYHTPASSLKTFINKINYYSALHAKSNHAENKRATIRKILVFPLTKFLVSFIFKKGYKDGTHGFVYGVCMAMHSYLAWSKLWLEQQETLNS